MGCMAFDRVYFHILWVGETDTVMNRVEHGNRSAGFDVWKICEQMYRSRLFEECVQLLWEDGLISGEMLFEFTR